MSLLCPKCHNVMNQYERNGVVLDQCTECKGLFLDRGELERLVSAESAFYGERRRGRDDDDDDRRRHEPRYEQRYDPRYERRHDDRDRHYDDDYRHGKKHKRRSFLEELFD